VLREVDSPTRSYCACPRPHCLHDSLSLADQDWIRTKVPRLIPVISPVNRRLEAVHESHPARNSAVPSQGSPY
jgi:hypothetical protein